jgi:hypothetical protein
MSPLIPGSAYPATKSCIFVSLNIDIAIIMPKEIVFTVRTTGTAALFFVKIFYN